MCGMMPCGVRRTLVHLAYLDDSDTRQKRHKWQVMAGVVMEDRSFKLAEIGMSVAQDHLGLSPEQLENFQEFHACELYGGYGFFEKVEQERRFDALSGLLAIIKMLDLGIVYGAVNLEELKKTLYSSADPLDICFRICIKGIASWTEDKTNKQVIAKMGDDYSIESMTPLVLESIYSDLTMLVLDECSDKKQRETLHRSFREIRSQRKPGDSSMLTSLHDDMYFGDSRYSLGIQIADACSYFIARHLDGDEETESFYNIIAPHIVRFETYPVQEKTEVNNAEEQRGDAQVQRSDGCDSVRQSGESEG
jgi:hypothetical protein